MQEVDSPVPKLRFQSNFSILYQKPGASIDKLTKMESQRFGKLNINDQIIESTPLLQYLAKPHQTLDDGRNIYMQIRNYSFFKDFFKDHNMQYDLDSIYHFCTKLQLEVFTKGQPVLREGTLSNNKMYLIVVGKILVTSRNIQYPLEKQKSVKKLANMSPKKSQSKLQVSDDPFYDTLQLKFGQVINELGQGSYFGERALLIEQQKAALRSASCIAYTDSYLLTLERQDFLEVLKQFKKDSQEKKDILTKCIPKFESIASTLIMENLMYSFKEEYKNIHDYITIQGQEADQFYILCNGEVAITKHYNDHQLLLSITSSFEVLGEESLFCDQYKYSIQALQQDTKLLKISAGSLLLRSPKVCINEIRKLMQQKELLRERQLHNILKQNDVQTLKNSEVEINQEQIMKTQIMYAQQQNTLISMQRSLTDRKCAEAIQKFAKESYPFIYSIQEMRDSLKQKKIHTNRTYKLTSKTDLKSTVSIQGIQELKKNLEKENRAQSINLLLTKQTPVNSRFLSPTQERLSTTTSRHRSIITPNYINNFKSQIITSKRKFRTKQLKILYDNSSINTQRVITESN